MDKERLTGRWNSDGRLVQLFLDRNEDAIQETQKKYGKMIFRIAFNILNNTPDSEECENDTYLTLWERIPPTRPDSLCSFAAKIVRDIAVDKYRSRTSQKRVPSELTVALEELWDLCSDHDSTEAEFNVRETSRLIGEYVRTLGERQHYIFIGRYYFGETLERLSKLLGCSVATAQRESVKVKNGLKDYLERNGVYI